MKVKIIGLALSIGVVFFAIVCCMVLLFSCNSEKKLTAKAETFTTKYPKKALPFFRGKFPCIETSVITYVNDTAYKASLDSIRAAIEFYKALLDAVEPTYIRDTINIAKKDSVCPDYRSEINRLNKLLKIKDAAYKDLLQRVDSVKPINTTNTASIKDSSEVKEVMIYLDEANKKIKKLEGKVIWFKWFSFWMVLFGFSIRYIIKGVQYLTLKKLPI